MNLSPLPCFNILDRCSPSLVRVYLSPYITWRSVSFFKGDDLTFNFDSWASVSLCVCVMKVTQRGEWLEVGYICQLPCLPVLSPWRCLRGSEDEKRIQEVEQRMNDLLSRPRQ